MIFQWFTLYEKVRGSSNAKTRQTRKTFALIFYMQSLIALIAYNSCVICKNDMIILALATKRTNSKKFFKASKGFNCKRNKSLKLLRQATIGPISLQCYRQEWVNAMAQGGIENGLTVNEGNKKIQISESATMIGLGTFEVSLHLLTIILCWTKLFQLYSLKNWINLLFSFSLFFFSFTTFVSNFQTHYYFLLDLWYSIDYLEKFHRYFSL